MPQGFLAAVNDAVGPDHCLSDPDLKASYERDWTRRFGAPALVVVRPASTSEVAKVLAACNRFQVAVVPQGGNTGLVGGSVPRGGEAVLSTSRLSRFLSCDPEEGLLVAEAGTTLAAAQAAAAGVHQELGIDIAARDCATLGGMVATNAGGIYVVRHGPMRARLGGLEVVLADGTVATRLLGLVKDNVGYDLAQTDGRKRRDARCGHKGRDPSRPGSSLPRHRPRRPAWDRPRVGGALSGRPVCVAGGRRVGNLAAATCGRDRRGRSSSTRTAWRSSER